MTLEQRDGFSSLMRKIYGNGDYNGSITMAIRNGSEVMRVMVVMIMATRIGSVTMTIMVV